MPQNSPIDAAHAVAVTRWQTPFAGFASGHDPRTSDQALLGLLHGGLVHAAHYDWTNAGRRLIDKTYIDILWHVQGLTPMRTRRPEQIAAALDGFITDTLRPQWQRLPQLTPDQRLATAIAWVEQMAQQCFGSVHSELAASRLMFYLMPMLPVFNLGRGHQLALAELGFAPRSDAYRDYAHAASDAYRDLLPALSRLPRPAVSDAAAYNPSVVESLMGQTDWWQRRVFDTYLQGLLGFDAVTRERLFGCDDGGQLSASPTARAADE